MPSKIGRILRSASRPQNQPLNILTFPTHEAYETNLCKTGHQFWAYRGHGIKDWNSQYRPLPDNYILLNPDKGDKQLPLDVDFDFILSQNKFGQFQRAVTLSQDLQLPIISLEHTLPPPYWKPTEIRNAQKMVGHFNVFISDFSREAWGWGDQAEVIHHGIDTDLFFPANGLQRKRQVASVVNDWINRDVFCGYKLWQQVSQGLPVAVLGDTPGLSKPAKSVDDLVFHYAQSQVFLNTSLVSPIPTALLEAMACGCACVSTATCMVPEIIQDGVNGFISNDPAVLRQRTMQLLENQELSAKLGQAARQTILEKFSLDVFVSNWNLLFDKVSRYVYTGEP